MINRCAALLSLFLLLTSMIGIIMPIMMLIMLLHAAPVAPAQLSQDESELTAYIIMPEELLNRIKRDDEGFVLVDVRSEDAFRERRIVGAVNLPWDEGVFKEQRGALPRNRTVILISSDGTLALKALRILLIDEYQKVESTFRETFSVEGGMENWPYKEYLITAQ
jgi:rhodanese-related sulfurtransferase